MKDHHIVEALREDYTTMVVQFRDRSLWTYKVLRADMDKYKPGSYVLVPNAKLPNATMPAAAPKMAQNQYEARKQAFEEDRTGFMDTFPAVQSGVVASIHPEPDIDFDSEFEYKWVVGPLDLTAFHQNLELDEKMRKEIQQARINSVRSQAKRALLESNPELKDLLLGQR